MLRHAYLVAGCAGIGYSDDKLLQSRIFSYPDTQRYRLGPNYLQLPWNAPKCPHHNNHHEGLMNFMHRDEEVRPRLGICLPATFWVPLPSKVQLKILKVSCQEIAMLWLLSC